MNMVGAMGTGTATAAPTPPTKAISLSASIELRRRESDPSQIAGDPQSLLAIRALGLPPFEVVSSPQLASALGISPRTPNDWRWLTRAGQPPCEPRELYRGRALVYRIDVLEDWARSGGSPRSKHELWTYGSDWLEQNHLPRTTCAETTNEMLCWLQQGDIIRLSRREPAAEPLVLYRDDDGSGRT